MEIGMAFCRVLLALLLMTVGARAEPITAGEITVTDGDTIFARGSSYRMIGYDTPESSTPRRKVSGDERAVALLAKDRLTELLRSGQVDLTEVPCSCPVDKIGTNKCNHGRKCGVLSVDGKNVGATLIAEELAMPFICSATKCPKMPDWPRIIEGYNNGSR